MKKARVYPKYYPWQKVKLNLSWDTRVIDSITLGLEGDFTYSAWDWKDSYLTLTASQMTAISPSVNYYFNIPNG